MVWTCDEDRAKPVTRRKVNMNMKGWRGKGRPKKRWIVSITQDMREMKVSDNMTIDSEERKRNIY
jgi:hypothetical protein